VIFVEAKLTAGEIFVKAKLTAGEFQHRAVRFFLPTVIENLIILVQNSVD
jgi:hypothetical protein